MWWVWVFGFIGFKKIAYPSRLHIRVKPCILWRLMLLEKARNGQWLLWCCLHRLGDCYREENFGYRHVHIVAEQSRDHEVVDPNIH